VGIITLLRGSIGRQRLDVPVSALTTARPCAGVVSLGRSLLLLQRGHQVLRWSSKPVDDQVLYDGGGASGRCPIDMPAGFALEAGAISGPTVAPDLGLVAGAISL